MKYLLEQWQTDKWKMFLNTFWLLTVATSFWHDGFLGFNVPGIGQIFPFRVLLPLTLILFAIWAVQNRFHLWKVATPMEKMLILLIGILLIHSGIGMAFAINHDFSFRRFFNLIYDLGFLFLSMCLCRDKKIFQITIWICLLNVFVLCILGIWECFFGPIFISVEFVQRVKLYGWKVYSPMVNISNTNSFMTSIMFLLAIFLLWWAPQKLKLKHYVGILELLMIVYFLLECAGARLLLIAFWILVFGIIVYAFLSCGKKTVVILLAAITILMGFSYTKSINLANNNEKYNKRQDVMNASNTVYMEEQLYEIGQKTVGDPMTGEESVKVRLRLLVHAMECFVESKGMGVGIGNTEQLARIRAVARNGQIWSIHCFIARLLGDYGIWVLLPICGYVFILLKYTISSFLQSIRKKDCAKAGYYLLFLLSAATFVLVSTSPSEAQDILHMWLFLGAIPLLIRFDEEEKRKREISMNKYCSWEDPNV